MLIPLPGLPLLYLDTVHHSQSLCNLRNHQECRQEHLGNTHGITGAWKSVED